MKTPFRVDPYLQWKYQQRTNNCWHLAQDVWSNLTGVDLGDQTPAEHSAMAYTNRAVMVANTLKKLDKLQDPCLVLFQRKRLEPHIGVYYRGKVLHMNSRGPAYQDIDFVSASYTTTEFYGNSC